MYERITAHYHWILDNTEDATYCNSPFWYKIKKQNNTTESTTKVVQTEQTEKIEPINNPKSSGNSIFNLNFIDWFYFIYFQLMAWLF